MLRLLAFPVIVVIVAVQPGAAQNSPSVRLTTPGTSVTVRQFGTLSGESTSATPWAESGRPLPGDSMVVEPAGGADPSADPARPGGIRRITLEQVKQSANPARDSVARIGQLSIEAAKQHRLGVQADYFPKFGATFVNVHFTEFLGEVLSIRRQKLGLVTQVPIPLLSQNQTIAALTFIQPVTPLLQIRQAVRIARADERVAIANAGVPIAKAVRDREIEDTYFRLLIAQRKLSSAESKSRQVQSRSLYAAVSTAPIPEPDRGPRRAEINSELVAAATEVRQLTASLNRIMGWPDDAQLELAPPEPLVENITLDQVSDKSVAANPDVIEAEQTVVKARAASAISKLEYVPTVAVVSGYLFQNAMPSVPSRFGYGGVIASYNLFDFGKRERAVKQARAKAEMAGVALQMTKAKVAAYVKKSYFELERSRQVSQVAQKMASSFAVLMNVSASSESSAVTAARVEVEIEMLKADLAHRQAYASLQALLGGIDRE